MEVNFVNILLHLLLFIGLIVVLKTLYIEPVLKLLRRRDALTSGRKESANELSAKIEQLRKTYEESISATKQALEQDRQDHLKRLRQESEMKTKQAQRDMDKKHSDYESGLQESYQEASKKIPQLASDLSQEIKRALVETKVVRAS